jgi:hypothetical protein
MTLIRLPFGCHGFTIHRLLIVHRLIMNYVLNFNFLALILEVTLMSLQLVLCAAIRCAFGRAQSPQAHIAAIVHSAIMNHFFFISLTTV